MRVATFKAITGSYKISDIKVTGAVGAGSDTVQKVNADGSWGDKYVYQTEEGTGWLADGWYKSDMETPVDDADVFGDGEALFVNMASEITLTYSGEVLKGQPVVQLAAGYNMVGNPTPVQVKISQIAVAGAVGAGSDTVQKVNADGSWGDKYVYQTEEGTGWLADGWYKSDMETPVDDGDVLEAGVGLFANVASDVILTFPTAL